MSGLAIHAELSANSSSNVEATQLKTPDRSISVLTARPSEGAAQLANSQL